MANLVGIIKCYVFRSNLLDILSNEWFVGIGGGVLSGLIVTLLTRYFFTKRDNREYYQKIEAVNKEVVYALRPGISEGSLPSEPVLHSLISATSRKYKVKSSDVYQPKQIAEELIKEIMDSSFISTETKNQYCGILSHLVDELQVIESNDDADEKMLNKHYQIKQNQQMSLTLGMFTGLTSVAITIVSIYSKAEIESSLIIKLYTTVVPVFIAASAALVSVAGMLAYWKLKKQERMVDKKT